MEVPKDVTQAKESLLPSELVRLKFCFEQGMTAFVKLKCGLYVGVHMGQLPHMEPVSLEGKWSLCRKLV